MEEKSTSTFKSGLINGIILGIALIAFELILHFTGLKFTKYVSLISYVILIAVIVYATNKYKKTISPESFSYGKALGLATLIVVFGAILLNIYTYFYVTSIDPEFITKSLAEVETELLNKGMPDEQIEMMVSVQRKMLKPGIIAISGLFGTVLIGFIISLITSIFLKKDGDPYQDAMQDLEE